ncbi:AMP-binding protein [Microbacterium sp. Root61]|uniref:AMP-binding protein n=1 Tax=Microbacterium sp. Root61 TaxID=1736570 RepID=UPI002E1133DA
MTGSLDVPTTMSVAAILAESALRHPDRVAVIDDVGGRTTFAQLWQHTRAYAGALRDLDVEKGTAVAMMIPNTVEFPKTYYAILALGAIVVPVHPLLKPAEIQHVLDTSGARLLIADVSCLAAASASAPEQLVQVGGTAVDDLATLSTSTPAVAGYLPMHPLAPAAMLFTSGTSGRSKAAVLSHLNLVEHAHVSLLDSLDVRADDIMCAALPLSHVFGQSTVMNTAFRRGAALQLVRRFHADDTLEILIDNGVTIFAGVPTMLIALLDGARRNPLRPPLRYVISGGSSLPVASLEAFVEVFGAPVHEGYGLSETSPTVTFNHTGAPNRAGTIGTSIWGMEVRIAVPDIADRIELLQDGSDGEVVVRGQNLFLGYHDDPAATAAAVVDGWFRTGDVGRRSSDGYITIIDRTKEMILRGGYNVYPREIEEVLARMPGVASVAVFGVADERNGEEVMAAVVPLAGAGLTADSVVRYARERIAAHKYPRRVVLVHELPLGPTGKVLKRELNRMYS